MEEKYTVVKVEPQKRPEVVEIGTELEDLQAAVGGRIEVVYPYEDMVGLLMNEEGKLLGMQLNRSLKDEEGQIYDIIAGTFYVIGLSEDDFCSLTDQQIENYLSMYEQPYLYMQMGKGIAEIPLHIITPDDDNHYFFGYYDLRASQGSRHLCHRVKFMDRLPEADDVAELGYLEKGEFIPFATTTAWNFQQGALLQYHPYQF